MNLQEKGYGENQEIKVMEKSILENNLMRKKVSNKNSFEIETEEKLSRNDDCWCGSGKKYKKCHCSFDEKLDAYRRKCI